MSLAALTASMEQLGFAWSRALLDQNAVAKLIAAVEQLGVDSARAGHRDWLSRCPAVAQFAASDAVTKLVNPVLGGKAFAVRGMLFDKTPEANWRVAWHQDLTIAVRERAEVPGFGPWSMKEGVPHVQPSTLLLERMLTLRLHLDECADANGPLRVIPGSHRHGKLDAAAINEWKDRGSEEDCVAQAGDALLMRPLLLHASSVASSPGHRRVVHLEFAAEELPHGLVWAERDSA